MTTLRNLHIHQYSRFWKTLPRTLCIPLPLSEIVESLCRKAHDEKLRERWLTREEVHQLWLKAIPHQPLDFEGVQQVFRNLFQERDLIVFGMHEIARCEREVEGDDGLMSVEQVFGFR